MKFQTYLHKVFRKNVREAGLINNGRQRTALINNEIDKLEGEYLKEREEDLEGFKKLLGVTVSGDFGYEAFTTYGEGTGTTFKIARGQREAMRMNAYEYLVKYMTSFKGQHTHKGGWGFQSYEYQNDEIKNPNHKDNAQNALRYKEDDEGKEECIFNLTHVNPAYVLSNNSLGKTVEDEVIEKEEDKELHKAIRQLTMNQQSIIYLHYFYGMPFKEVAELMECNVSNVYQHHTLAINKLQKLLTKGEVTTMTTNTIKSNSIKKETSLTDYPRWYGNTKDDYSQYVNSGHTSQWTRGFKSENK